MRYLIFQMANSINYKMATLRDLYYTKGYEYYPTDKGTTHCYIDSYDKLFKPFQKKKINVLEVGVREGGSIRLWSDYFTNAKIYGYDIENTAYPANLNEKITYIVKDINKVLPEEVSDLAPTIAIDDGSHSLSDQLAFVKLVYPHIKTGGLLIVEDIQNLDRDKPYFEELGYSFDVVDVRQVQNRYDDVLLVFKK